MRFVIFSHSLVSDWNHGNAHFLRGVGLELVSRGFEVQIFEPCNGWSRQQLLRHYGHGAILEFERAFPGLRSTLYDLDSLNLDQALEGADVVLVHEWNDRELVARIGEHHLGNASYRLYFHDTHHRAATAQASISSLDLSGYDGVLANGGAIAELYRRCGWASQAWTWHEAADTRTFYPRRAEGVRADVGWIGNWGDDERAEELREFFIRPVAALRLKACVYGVRYPLPALREFIEAGIQYHGWNSKLPRAGRLRAMPRYHSRATSALRQRAPRNPDHPAV